MRKRILLLVSSLILFLFFCSCNSTSYDIEEVEKTDTTSTYTRTEVRQESEASKPEIKEEPVEIQPKIDKKFAIQIGAFQFEANALDEMNKAQNLITYKIYYNLSGGLYKVRLGEFDSFSDALTVIDSIKNAGYNDSFIVDISKSN